MKNSLCAMLRLRLEEEGIESSVGSAGMLVALFVSGRRDGQVA